MKLEQVGPNQTVLKLENCKVLFSYDTPVAIYYCGNYYKSDTFYSKTTTKHINAFSNEYVELEQTAFDKMLSDCKAVRYG